MRKVCIVTGSRAEYGLLSKLMKLVSQDPDLKLQVVATGMHLSPEFGFTYKEIEADGIRIDAKVEMLEKSDDSPVGIAKSSARGLAGCAEAFDRLRPDIVVVLGDRFEILAAVQAALFARIPVAHISGGERTEGAIDESMRHAITKMSHLHFVSTEEYRKRVVQLGESPERVFNVGALNVDVIADTALMPREELERSLGVKFKRRNLIATFHPATLEDGVSPAEQFKEMLAALDGLDETFILFTKPNADAGGRSLFPLIDEFVEARKGMAAAFVSLGRVKYYSALGIVDGVVGNSSSGLSEAPSFKIGSVNIGDRQKGRIRAASVIDCPPEAKAIRTAIDKLYSKEFRDGLENLESPFGKPGASRRILDVLKSADLSGVVKKTFHDIKSVQGLP